MNRKTIFSLLALMSAAVVLAACGSDDSGDTTSAATTEETTTEETTTAASGGKGGTIEVVADPSALAYTTGELTVDSGPVTIDFENPATLEHDVRIESESGEDLGGTSIISESSESVELELEPGTYTYYCSVGGHRAAGMEDTLVVK